MISSGRVQSTTGEGSDVADDGARATVELARGTLFNGRYRVLKKIASGGMGALYAVLHMDTGRRRALKTMLPALVRDPDMRSRFRLEATVTATVHSDHVVDVLDSGVDAATGLPFIVMEFLSGEDLLALLQRRGRLEPGEAVELLHQASLALDCTHDAGIVHRDLKPSNLFVARTDTGAARLKILDFGIAKLVAESTLAETTRNLGTPMYMAPEQITGDGSISASADLYALGHIAFELLTGRPFFYDESRGAAGVFSLLFKIASEARSESAVLRARRRGVVLPAAFDAWFAKATAHVPSERFPSAGCLVVELASTLGIELDRATSEPGAPASARKDRAVPRPAIALEGESSGTTLGLEAGDVDEHPGDAAPAMVALSSPVTEVMLSGDFPMPTRVPRSALDGARRRLALGAAALALASLGYLAVSARTPGPDIVQHDATLAASSEAVAAAKSEPVAAARSEPVAAARSEPVAAARSEPVPSAADAPAFTTERRDPEASAPAADAAPRAVVSRAPSHRKPRPRGAASKTVNAAATASPAVAAVSPAAAGAGETIEDALRFR